VNRRLQSLSRSRVGVSTVGAPSPDDLGEARARTWRLSDTLVGLALVLGGGLAAMLTFQSATETVSVVGVARGLERGHVIARGDLVAIEVAKDVAGSFIPADRARETIGRSLAIDVTADTPLVDSMLATTATLQPGETLVPFAVKAGRFPPALAPGDLVRLALIPDFTAGAGAEPMAWEETVTVWSVTRPVDSFGDVVVTVRGSLELPVAIAAAGAVHVSLVSADVEVGP
jgi:hypothetical protein